MCFKVECSGCGKATWGGCGNHVDMALRGVPEKDRCPEWNTSRFRKFYMMFKGGLPDGERCPGTKM